MRSAAMVVALVLGGLAAAAALLVLAPAPARQLASLAVAVDEKSFLLAAAALSSALLAWAAIGPRCRLGPTVALLLAAFAFGVALIPPLQAVALASEHSVRLDVRRYLRSPIERGQSRPRRTLTFATVDGRPLALDVYAPPRPGPTPAVIVVHGDDWSSGDKGEATLESERLAAAGYAVFDVQYRVDPAPNWRAAAGDVKCAVGWVKQHAGDAGVAVDPRRVALLGRSAGGHLALLAAYSADDPDLPPSCATGETGVDAVVALYAPTDLVWDHANPGPSPIYDSTARLERFLGGTPDTAPEAYRKASVTERVRPGLPRTLLIHGGRDQFVSPTNALLLATKLAGAGVARDLLIVPYGQHRFDYVLDGLSGQIAHALILRFLGSR